MSTASAAAVTAATTIQLSARISRQIEEHAHLMGTTSSEALLTILALGSEALAEMTRDSATSPGMHRAASHLEAVTEEAINLMGHTSIGRVA